MNILELMDKSKIHVAYEYKFCHGTNASQMTENIMKCLVTMWQISKLSSDGLRGFGLVISDLKINPMVGLQPRSIMMS